MQRLLIGNISSIVSKIFFLLFLTVIGPAQATITFVNGDTGTNTGGTETRATFDDICDYDLPEISNASVTDQLNNPVPALSDYRVTVDIIDDAGADLNSLSGTARESLRIDVQVTHVSNPMVDVTMTGYRANY